MTRQSRKSLHTTHVWPRPRSGSGWLCLACGLIFFTFASSFFATAQQDDLSNIQQQIAQTEQQKAAREARRNELFRRLQAQESEIAILSKEINQTNIAISQNRAQINDLQIQTEQYREAITVQRDLLGRQILSAYAAGDYDLAKVIFNQENVAELERMLTYYQFVYQDRKSTIDKFVQQINQLRESETALAQAQEQSMRLLARLEGQSIELSAQRLQRQKSIEALESQIQSDIVRIQQLKEDEERLTQAIAEAERLAADALALSGLSQVKGALIQPAQGKVMHQFGKRRQGQLKWKGMTINGEAGSPIFAIHTGKVIFADWLRGFGLVLVLEHGDGYMSVYGHNQAILKSVGDIVKRGETIALMGQSGGQIAPNLYFELRHKGVPLNPRLWLSP